MPNKAIETFRVVMPRNPLEELLRLESIRKSRSKDNIFKKGRKRLRENTQSRKNLALRKYIPRKYKGLRIELIL
jgi:hypothetical protein